VRLRLEWERDARQAMARLEKAGASRFKRERMANLLEAKRLTIEPTAGELVASGVSVEDALAQVDERTRQAQQLLGVVLYPYLGRG